jgi:hypothetical protein
MNGMGVRSRRLSTPAPATESAFHNTKFASDFSGIAFPFAENTFRIAKFVGYLIDK